MASDTGSEGTAFKWLAPADPAHHPWGRQGPARVRRRKPQPSRPSRIGSPDPCTWLPYRHRSLPPSGEPSSHCTDPPGDDWVCLRWMMIAFPRRAPPFVVISRTPSPEHVRTANPPSLPERCPQDP